MATLLSRTVALCFVAGTSIFFAAGCASETEAEMEATDASDENGEDETLDADELSGGCSLSRTQILNAASGGRRTAIERGFRWLDKDVSYSQSRSFEGYRTDCSGFISMCWQLRQSYTTASFKGGSGENEVLRTYDQLIPGDALVRRSGSSGHIVMFLGWNDRAKSSACVIEQRSTAQDMVFGTRSTSKMRSSGYLPIRADKF
jgi:hypothetical protein